MREVPPTAGLPLSWHELLPIARGPSFEEALADFLGTSQPLVCCSGTAALVIALTALKRRSARRRVIVPAYTCPLVAMAILHCGLVPVACDLRAGDFQPDVDRLDALCDAGTLAVIPTHLGGRVAEIEPVRRIARRNGAAVIEDAAQAFGAFHHGARDDASDAVFYSFAVGKGLTLYEGGLLVARDETLRAAFVEVAKELARNDRIQEMRRCAELAAYAALYRPWALRFAYGAPLRRALSRGNVIEAVGDDFSGPIPLHAVGRWRKGVGSAALKRLPEFLRQCTSLAARRLARFGEVAGATVLRGRADATGTWPFFMVLMPSVRSRDAALAKLWRAGLGVTRLYIHALQDYPYLHGLLEAAEAPHARELAARMLTVTNSPWLSDADFEHICRVLEAETASAG